MVQSCNYAKYGLLVMVLSFSAYVGACGEAFWREAYENYHNQQSTTNNINKHVEPMNNSPFLEKKCLEAISQQEAAKLILLAQKGLQNRRNGLAK